jgi:hypothetical protein
MNLNVPMKVTEHPRTVTAASAVTPARAIAAGWLLCAVLDIAAAFGLAWLQAGRSPAAVLRGVTAALWGAAAMQGGASLATVGLTMHLGVALAWTLVCYYALRRFAVLRTAPLLVIGPLYGALVWASMNYAVLPATSWLRSLYLGTPPRWPGGMGWQLFVIHLVFVGLPIVWGVRRAFATPDRLASRAYLPG